MARIARGRFAEMKGHEGSQRGTSPPSDGADRALPSHEPLRTARRKVLALAFGLVVAVGLVGVSELGLRVWSISRRHTRWFGLVAPSRSAGYVPKPNSYVLNKNVVYRLDSHGFRISESHERQRPSRGAIFGLGDSITFGIGLPYEKTYLARLEELLARTGRNDVRVVNAACIGYDPYQELLWFRSGVARFKPKGLILGYCVNDDDPVFAVDFVGNRPAMQRWLPLEWVLATGSWVEELRYFLFRKSGLYQCVARAYGQLRMAVASQGFLQRQHRELQMEQARWKAQNRQSFEEICMAAKQASMPLLVVVFPLPSELHADGRPGRPATGKPSEHARWVLRTCKRLGVQAIDLGLHMSRGMFPANLDMHPLASGNLKVAQVIGGRILASWACVREPVRGVKPLGPPDGVGGAAEQRPR